MRSVLEIAKAARLASLKLATAPTKDKNAALENIARLLDERRAQILEANALDAKDAQGKLSKPMLERLTLTNAKLDAVIEGVRQVTALPDPVGEIIEETTRPNGLVIKKVRTPIGVIGIIYESRPNVTVDCACLCLKSGNACILRGGSEAFRTNSALALAVRDALAEAGLDADCVQTLPSADRALVAELLKMNKYVHCIIPRGGEGLIRYIVENSSIPVIKHYKGVCSAYIAKSADVEEAKRLVVDAKCQRPSVCNALENLLVDAQTAPEVLPQIARSLLKYGVELRARDKAREILENNKIPCTPASEDDFYTEYTDLVISIDTVPDVEAAAAFINEHGSGHSDMIVTESPEEAEKFMNLTDSATAYWNASTRFTDGFEFGLGAEIGISTDKLHARGPMGLRELCSYKYKIFGHGQTRGNLPA